MQNVPNFETENSEKSPENINKSQIIKKVFTKIFCVVGFLCILAAALIAVNQKTVIMDFQMPEIDDSAIYTPGDEDSNYDLEIPEGGGAGAVTYSDQVTIDLSERKIYLNFQNPSGSPSSLLLHVFVEDKEIANTGLLPAGYGITTIEDVDVSGLSEGNYDGSFKADNYDPETGEKAILDLNIDIDVSIVK